MTNLVHLKSLVSYPSITPHDEGCQRYMIDYLSTLGFQIVTLPNPPVDNFIAYFGQENTPIIGLAGHTDVVSPGDELHWTYPPFELTEENDLLYGRGVADMKGALAIFLSLAKTFSEQTVLNQHARLLFIITSGEEGDDFLKGTPYILNYLKENNLLPTYCFVGEPSSQHIAGDMIKVGRRGSLSCQLRFTGKQGHVAYPSNALNPIHAMLPLLSNLASHMFDNGNDYFDPTHLQFTRIHSDSGGRNVIPMQLEADFNIRFNTEHTPETLLNVIKSYFESASYTPELTFIVNGLPFLTPKGHLTDIIETVVHTVLGIYPVFSTTGGTSDARFIAPYGIDVIELGLCNATIHQVNESISKHSFIQLESIYQSILFTLIKSLC
jgi:succinyl-diaminopimelate desuccinylase